jgi:hypothetical protein
MSTSSPFPLFRVDLNQVTSHKLAIDETLVFEHVDDDNYSRNRVHNLSVSIVKNAKLNRKTMQFGLGDLDTAEATLAGLKANFPDTQFKVYPATEKQGSIVRVFWS